MISVVLPVRDGLPWLDGQLEALAAQHCDLPWEIVVMQHRGTTGTDGGGQRGGGRVQRQ